MDPYTTGWWCFSVSACDDLLGLGIIDADPPGVEVQMDRLAVRVDGGGVLGVLVDRQALAVVELDLVLDEVAQEGGELDRAGHAAVGEEQLLGMKVYCSQKLLSDDAYYGEDTKGTVLEKEDALKVFAALQEDLNSVDPDTFLRELPFALIQCQMDLTGAGFGEKPYWVDESYGWADRTQPIWTAAVPVYPSFEKTGKALKALGIEPVKTPDAEDVTKIEIWETDEATGTEKQTTVTDTDQIRQLLEGMTLSCAVPYTRGGSGMNSWTSPRQMVTLYVKAENGEEIICSGWLKE